jgi:hypothetical protein
MHIRLIQKLADVLDGVDLSRHRVGDVFDAISRDARLLIAERWAVRHAPETRATKYGVTISGVRAHAADECSRPLPAPKRLGDIVEAVQPRLVTLQDHHRAVDKIRDKWHDEHAIIIRSNRNRKRMRPPRS